MASDKKRFQFCKIKNQNDLEVKRAAEVWFCAGCALKLNVIKIIQINIH